MGPGKRSEKNGEPLHHTFYTLDGHVPYKVMYCEQCHVLHKENLDADEGSAGVSGGSERRAATA